MQPEQLYQYASRDDLGLPEGRFGASMLRAIDMGIWPSWALFTYSPLKQAASGPAAEPCIALANDVLVLAPQESEGLLSGLVVAQESASDKVRQLVAPDGTVYTVKVPKIHTKFVADDGLVLQLLAVNTTRN